MEALVEKLHGHQMRGNGDSNALHVKRVRALLMESFAQTQEVPADREALELAALGHDLLEDTPATENELRLSFGEHALQLIQEMTNREGDTHTAGYVAQMRDASEEARLIKYADLCDNLLNVSYGTRVLGRQWIHDYFLPIVDPMREALDLTSFKKFPKTANILRAAARLARAHLQQSITAL